jgi:hypothetical protein
MLFGIQKEYLTLKDGAKAERNHILGVCPIHSILQVSDPLMLESFPRIISCVGQATRVTTQLQDVMLTNPSERLQS